MKNLFQNSLLPWRGARPWQVGEFGSLLNRRGETLVSARITRVLKVSEMRKNEVQQVEVEVPAHLIVGSAARSNL